MSETDSTYQKLSVSDLRKELSPKLPKEFFRPSRSRLVFVLVSYLCVAANFYAATQFFNEPTLLSCLCLIATVFIACNTSSFFFFFMHEVLHGSVFRSKKAIYFSSFLGAIPALCSPSLWNAWHHHHHRHTSTKEDTDRIRHEAYDDFSKPMTKIHRVGKSFYWKYVVPLFVPFFTISGHHFLMYVERLTGGGVKKIPLLKATVEYALVLTLFALPIIFLDTKAALLGIYLPIFIGHLICNVYILTNHNNDPLTEENYPLLNSTSVYIPFFAWTHMGFGRHTEHHIYPHVSHDKLRHVTALLRETHEKNFREDSLFSSIFRLFKNDANKVVIKKDSNA